MLTERSSESCSYNNHSLLLQASDIEEEMAEMDSAADSDDEAAGLLPEVKHVQLLLTVYGSCVFTQGVPFAV